MERLDGKSMDLVRTNIEALKQLFPEVVTEGKIDFEKLKLVLGEEIEKRNERYEFTWYGKTQAMKLAQTPSTGTLRPDKQSSKNWDTTENVYIEGDNLEVLKLLQKSYFGKIKMIYIDPPYNTGKDFVYKDDFRDNIKNYKEMTQQTTKANTETNGRYHTDWLNMMYPRLKLARNLLREDGVIFISIDDHEMANLKKICDEIFGEENFIGVFVVNSTPNARDYGHIGKMHEYVLFYAKNIEMTQTYMLPNEEKAFKYEDEMGGFNIHPLYNSNVAFNNTNRPNLFYPFYLNPLKKIDEHFYEISLEKKERWIEIYPPKSIKDNVQFVWRWGKDKAKLGLMKEIIGYKTEDGEYRIVQKMRHTEKIIRSLLLERSYTSRRGTAEIEQIFGKKIFTFPKPVELIYTFVKVATEKDSLVLDFFSGSATLAEAVMKLNSEDHGNRRYVLIQLPERCDGSTEAYKAGYKNICEIGKERIRRAGEKIVQETGKTDLDIGFKVFTLDSSNMKTWDPDFENLEQTLLDLQNNMKEDRTKEDLLYEILLKIGLPLTTPIEEIDYNGKTIYNVGFGSVLLCLEDDIDLDIVHEMMKHQSEHLSPKVIFKESGFINDSVKMNAIQTLKKNGINDVRSV
ncbi:site-specific DNA-methyltransferase [Anoxybacillus flavithermus]|uniref:Adenine-specific DNA-methyltransferase n=1 Tax=Anoxybacillus flavithermus AK1 TaxID=1297581 RepID=M8D4P6_9BACL|nr:site-specific DNA-methyltransferase [Anoxybacillus flavithermus]EMT45811.1 adenine-specific DNA-methyltransferase [Anoxybacillus flavithermus AK1]